MQIVVKSGAQTVVNTADINRQDKDIYINLFNKYKEQIRGKGFHQKMAKISEAKETEEYQALTDESKQQLFLDLMQIQ